MGPQKSRGLYRLLARGSNQPADAGIRAGSSDTGLRRGLPARRASQTDLRYHGAFL